VKQQQEYAILVKKSI